MQMATTEAAAGPAARQKPGLLSSISAGDLDPYPRMVAGPFPPAHLRVHARRGQTPGYAGAEQQVVGPETRVAVSGGAQLIAEGVKRRLRMQRAQ